MVLQKIPSQARFAEQAAKRSAKLAADPTCSKCGKRKSVDDFPPTAVDYWCYACRSEYATRLYHKRRDGLSKAGLKKLRAEVNRRQRHRRKDMLARMSADELAVYKAKINFENRERRRAIKQAAFMGYGGFRCACCGESEPHFLSIDHKNNDGAAHKRLFNLRTGEEMYRWIVKNGFPDDLQVLCMNCNWGKRFNGGVCPHVDGKV